MQINFCVILLIVNYLSLNTQQNGKKSAQKLKKCFLYIKFLYIFARGFVRNCAEHPINKVQI